jgi:hypothetical protein
MKMKKMNIFKVSEGNMAVLALIPEMMQKPEYRQELRSLTLKYIFEKNGEKK